MLLYFIRHGAPTYNPDELTPLGHRQAEAIGKRLAVHGVDRIYASTSNRAMQTAKPAAELLGKEIIPLDFCHEDHAWVDLAIDAKDRRKWLFQDTESRLLFTEKSMRDLGFRWYEHPAFEKLNYKKGLDRIHDETDQFLLSLGYEHVRQSGGYKIINDNPERIALFAHQGFGSFFLSHVLDMPYPQYALHFDLFFTGMTVLEFKNEEGFAMPQVISFSSDAHLYKEGLPNGYHDALRF